MRLRAPRRGALASGQPFIRTAQLLLRMGGIEVAARPGLYPRPARADTGIKARLNANGWECTLPSIKKSIMRKLSCRVADFYSDFWLFSLLFETSKICIFLWENAYFPKCRLQSILAEFRNH